MSGEQLAFPLTLFSGDQAYRGVIRATYWRCITLGLAALLVAASPVGAQTPTVKIAAPFSLTGPNTTGGVPALDAVRLAIEEANASGDGPNIELRTYDDRSDDNAARDAARQIAASDALVVVGPGATTASQAAGPIYAEAGLAAIAPYALGAGGPASPTTFRLTFSTSDMGEALARYLRRVLGGTRAVVIYRDNGFGRPIAMGFRGVAEQIGIAAAYHAFTKPEDAVAFARQATADPEHPAIVLGMLDQDAAPVVAALARQGPKPLILGPTAIAHVAFADNFTKEPEASRDRGFFTDGIYAVSGLIFDSANAEALTFAARYRARYGREPRFEAAQGYDAAHLAIAAGRAAIASSGASDMAARRAAVRGYLASLDSPAHAVTSLTGPLWFTPDRGRQQPIRVGRFHGTLFESAPLQLVPVSNPTSVEINAGALMDLGGGRFERRQQVVYTGVFINEISRVDIAQSTFTADFYLWLRFARAAGAGAADPTDIDFPDLLRGGFDPKRPT